MTTRARETAFRAESGRSRARFFADGIRCPDLSSKGVGGTAGRDCLVSQGVHRRLNGRVPVARCERRSVAAARRHDILPPASIRRRRIVRSPSRWASFPILSDATKDVARAYGVLAPSGYASRWTFYIGADGRILDIDKKVSAASHGARRRREVDPTHKLTARQAAVRLERVWHCSIDSAPRPGHKHPDAAVRLAVRAGAAARRARAAGRDRARRCRSRA